MHSNTVNPITSDAVQKEVWDLLELPFNYDGGISVGATQNSTAKGAELQLTDGGSNAPKQASAWDSTARSSLRRAYGWQAP